MRVANFSKAAFLLTSLLFIGGASGARKAHSHGHHHSKATAAVTPPVATPIVESDHMHPSSAPSTAQSRSSASLAAERASAAAGYSQPVYSSPYDQSLMSESVAEAYYDPVMPTPHHHHQHQHVAAASGHYHHHVPATQGHARHTVSTAAYAPAASSANTYATVPYQHGYYGYGYDYPGRYVAQGSHHHDAYAHKRGHGYGWHPDLEIQTLFFIGIPLIIIPLLFLWPYFLYSLHYRGAYAHPGYGGYRSASGTAEVVATPEKELKAKTDELTKKIVPKLSKQSKAEKSTKSSSSSS